MTPKPSSIRRLYDAAALFAVLNMTAAVALIGYVLATGAVDAKKLREVGMVLRGVPLAAAATPQTPPTSTESLTPTHPGKEVGAESEADVEMAHCEAERIRTELEQRLALSNSILLKIREEREAFQKERDAEALRVKTAAEVQKTDGFQKQVAILESLSAKVALEHLMAVEDVDEAAKVLAALSTSKAKKIIESAKRGAEKEQMKTILRRLRETVPTKLADLGGEERS